MPTYRFPETKVPASKNLPCPDCGKKVKRSTTFSQTTNPFTTPPNQTPEQIRVDLAPKIAAWKAMPVRCTPCEELAHERLLEAEAAAAHEFNAAHSVGTPVTFVNAGEPRTGVTSGLAYVTPGNPPYASIPLTVDGRQWGSVRAADLTVTT